MSMLESLPADVLQLEVVALLDPSSVLRLGACCRASRALVAQRRQALLLSRHLLRVASRSSRTRLQRRHDWVAGQVKPQQPLERLELQSQLLQLLQSSPDGIRDLAGAIQTALSAVTNQNRVPPCWLRVLRRDLVKMVHFLCLLAWSHHLRSRRLERQQQQQQQQQQDATGPNTGGADGEDADADAGAVQVVLLPVDQQQLEVTAGDAEHQQDHAPAPEAAGEQAGAAAVPVASAGVQTELGPSLRELRELLAGFGSLMTAESPSLKPCSASLQLLLHHLRQQLSAWNLAPAAAGEAGGDAGHGQDDEEDDDVAAAAAGGGAVGV